MKTKDDFKRNSDEFYRDHNKAQLSADEATEIYKLCLEDAEKQEYGDPYTFGNGVLLATLYAYAAGYMYGYRHGKRKNGKR